MAHLTDIVTLIIFVKIGDLQADTTCRSVTFRQTQHVGR